MKRKFSDLSSPIKIGNVTFRNRMFSALIGGTYMTDKSRQHSMHQWGPCDTVRIDGVKVKALTEEMLQDIVVSYGKTTALAKCADFNTS